MQASSDKDQGKDSWSNQTVVAQPFTSTGISNEMGPSTLKFAHY